MEKSSQNSTLSTDLWILRRARRAGDAAEQYRGQPAGAAVGRRSTRYASVPAEQQVHRMPATPTSERHTTGSRRAPQKPLRPRRPRLRISTCSTTSGRRSTRPSLYRRRARRSTGFAASQRRLPYPARLHARVIIRLTLASSEAIPSQTRISSVNNHQMIIISDPKRDSV